MELLCYCLIIIFVTICGIMAVMLGHAHSKLARIKFYLITVMVIEKNEKMQEYLNSINDIIKE